MFAQFSQIVLLSSFYWKFWEVTVIYFRLWNDGVCSLVVEDQLESPLDLVTFCRPGSIFLVVFHFLCCCSQGESLTCSGDAGAALEEGGSWQSQNFPAMLLEMGRRLGRIPDCLGCHQSCVGFMAVKLVKVADPAQSNQTQSSSEQTF